MTVNVQEEMNNSINILLDTNKAVGEYEYALDVLDEFADDLDFAIGIFISVYVNNFFLYNSNYKNCFRFSKARRFPSYSTWFKILP